MHVKVGQESALWTFLDGRDRPCGELGLRVLVDGRAENRGLEVRFVRVGEDLRGDFVAAALALAVVSDLDVHRCLRWG